jgi:hypothetical protein
MAGTAKTSKFMLSSATLMIGAMSALYDLNPADHSVGLVKNFQIMTEPTFTDLTQGTKNTTVFSALTGNAVKGQAEVHEYTARNLTYALSLDGSSVSTDASAVKTLTAPIVSGDSVVALNSVTGLVVGKHVMIYDTTVDDAVLVRKITDIDGLDVTFDQDINSNWATATTAIKQVNSIDLGSNTDSAYVSAVATGKLADGTPMAIRMPKVRIIKGFTLAFNSSQYGNMPFELDLIDMLPTDTFYADFITKKASLFTP